MNDESRPNHSDLLLLSMDSAEAHRDHSNGINYEINDSEMVLSASHLVNSNTYTLPSMKPHCEMLRCSNSSAEYLSKDGFINDITDTVPLNLPDMNSRYRLNKQSSINFQKEPLTDDSGSAYALKSLTSDIQDLSFSVDLRTLNRDVQESSNYNYYNRNVTSSADMYGTEFSHEFSNNNFATNLPSTSGMFSNDDTSTNYVLSEAQSDELLLNGIELNENEKLILSNEEIAMLTQGKPGSCLELILNNGEVLYAVIDTENDYTPTSPRMMQVSKEILPPRQVELDNNLVPVNELQTEHYSSNFSKTPPITEFTTSNSTNYHSVISTTLSKSINTSPITTENFNLCCNFSTDDSTAQFSSVMHTYPSIVSEKHYESLPSYCASTSAQKEIPTQTDSKIVSNPQVQPIPSKLDYFPNAVNSIVVSETGKKYPKKYSFYSNNFSSFLNQEQTSKDSPSKDDHTSNNREDSNRKTSTDESIRKPNETEQELLKRGFQPVASCDLQKKISSPTESVTVLKRNIISVPAVDNRTSVINVNTKKQLNNEEKIINSKCLNSRAQPAVNTICDRAVQSRARATLPSAYLSINRIKSEPGSKKSVYGVFARKTIPSRTQFGPVEGILIKQEEDDTAEDKPDLALQLTVESEKGKFLQLDVSNEELSNWMRFVRPAKTFQEQNLILGQQGSSLYFTTIEVIHPKQELLVWYGAYYSQTRNYFLLSGDPCANSLPCKDFDRIETIDLDKSPPSSPDTEQTTQNDVDNDVAVCMDIDKYDDDVIIETDFCSNSVAESGIKSIKAKSAISIKKQDKLNKSLWLCTYCDLTFSNASVMNLHILIHAADNVEETSPEKSKQFDDQSETSCPQCNQVFPEIQQLIVHVSKHGLKVQRWCDKNVDRDKSDKTVEEPEDEIFECSPCKKKFKNPAALSVHKRFHSDDSVLECPICETTFQKLTAMREHVHNHAINGIYTCPHCPKKYDRYKHIRKHIRACHCKVTFSCKLCKMNFKSQYKLKSHMLKHSDEREFLCANCGKQFKRKDKLTEHMKNMHSEERERKSLEIMNNATKKGRSMSKKTLKKRLPTKVLRLITENVNDYFYKCYICNIGFKRRGMLVNHLNSFHPGVGLDTVPELNVPILKAYCNFYCLYCDKVYKSNSKRKAHIIKSHPGAKIPGNLERGTVLNDPYAKHVGSVISSPFNCEFCPRQYASRAKLLNHHRKNHADLLPPDMKAPRSWNSQRRRRKTEVKLENVPINTNGTSTATPLNNVQIQSVEFEIENNSALGVNVSTQEENDLQQTTKENSGDVNQQIISLTHLLNEELRNSTTQEQYLKILQSSNGITIAQTDENGEHPVSLENSSALLQQILASYSFTSS